MSSDSGSGSGSRLPSPVLVLSGVSTLVAVLLSAVSIYLQLKSYRKPLLQRMVVRIMLMVPIYAIASLISLFSLEAAFVIDAIRDIYEAYVIYCFFVLLLTYLGGERSLLILLHGRPPKDPPFPVSIFKRELDVSDPYTFLFLKRGILQYVQIKPILAATTLILKACGKYNEGDFRANSGYLYVSIIYNISICLALYCLAMFWLCVSEDLKPYRPVPKFLCVKGILFFSFWQSVLLSILVAANVIRKLGPYTDPEHISVGLNDTLICIEMPMFALAHLFAFSYTDYIDPKLHYCARMPIRYAFKDAFSIKDIVEDSKATLRGKGMDYREFEPAEGVMHQGLGRYRRIKAGLRYSKGGKKKYWLPDARGGQQDEGRLVRAVDRLTGGDDVRAPLLGREADNIVHLAPDMQSNAGEHEDPLVWDSINHGGYNDDDDAQGLDLPFGDITEADEALYEHSRQYLFGDYNYPVIDVSSEGAKLAIWSEEERVLRDERGAWQSPIRQVKVGLSGKLIWEGYGAVGKTQPRNERKGLDKGTDGDDNDNNGVDSNVPQAAKDMGIHWAHAYDGESVSRWSPRVQNGLQRGKGEGPSARPSSSGTNKSTPTSHGLGTVVSRTSSATASTSSSISLKNQLERPKSKPKSQPKHPARTPLPPDAVDLVVEDQARERKKSESGVDGTEGLRKVYRRGFALHGGGEHEEPRIRDSAEVRGSVSSPNRTRDVGDERVERGEEILESIGSRPHEFEGALWERDSSRTQHEPVVARASTPPSHVRIVYDEMDGHNPWA
ncbi:hypothetical protein AMATHDRAFT_151933 [Amanita thiersii Skay4041]|uniref:DUF300-domain-containing protein n=1 Tax=Amanita thiersii Skay4041 TaxID=703135 RepID=A0A2A9NIB2_9AGAR|nr:hypothetical protein AMATHDRAFT_151933 [Amanita thiersii Skay4041]